MSNRRITLAVIVVAILGALMLGGMAVAFLAFSQIRSAGPVIRHTDNTGSSPEAVTRQPDDPYLTDNGVIATQSPADLTTWYGTTGPIRSTGAGVVQQKLLSSGKIVIPPVHSYVDVIEEIGPDVARVQVVGVSGKSISASGAAGYVRKTYLAHD